MPNPFPETGAARPEPPAADRAARVRELAAAAWAILQRHGILPAPRNFDLVFTYCSGGNPELTRRLDAILERGEALSPLALDAVHRECIVADEVDLDAVSTGSDAIQETAQALVEQVAGNQAAIKSYGDTLAHWAGRLGDEPTIGGLVGAIATLTAETTRAAERNRVLEQQLSASATRIARLRHSLAEVKQRATTDALTGIANRRTFEATLKRAMVQARSGLGALSVLLIDIDHFKRFNDTYGHKTGDLVLRLVARVLADNVKGRDCAARYGGEEFAVLLAGADLRAAAIVARQICEAICGKHLVNKGSGQGLGHITISAGVAQYQPGESAASLVERADIALYEAKHTGRNKVCVEAETLEASQALQPIWDALAPQAAEKR